MIEGRPIKNGMDWGVVVRYGPKEPWLFETGWFPLVGAKEILRMRRKYNPQKSEYQLVRRSLAFEVVEV